MNGWAQHRDFDRAHRQLVIAVWLLALTDVLIYICSGVARSLFAIGAGVLLGRLQRDWRLYRVSRAWILRT